MNCKDSDAEPQETYDKIVWARTVLNLPESATLREIKDNYRRQIQRWHPDKCREDEKICCEMTNRIIRAYEIIMEYCMEFRFPFDKQSVEKYLSVNEWWRKKFGDDPLWGRKDT